MSIYLPANFFQSQPLYRQDSYPVYGIEGSDITIFCAKNNTTNQNCVYLVKARQKLSDDFLTAIPHNVAIMFADLATALSNLDNIKMAGRFAGNVYFVAGKTLTCLKPDGNTWEETKDYTLDAYFFSYQISFTKELIKNLKAARKAHNEYISPHSYAEAAAIVDKVKEVLLKTNVRQSDSAFGIIDTTSRADGLLPALKKQLPDITWTMTNAYRIHWVVKFEETS